MKQTSSALTFLMAQYRAIFKRAYIKGIASAVLLTAGLAAGATSGPAMAAVNDTILDAEDFSSGAAVSSGTITQSSTINMGSLAADKFSGTWTVIGDTVLSGPEADITITGAAGKHILVSGSSGDLTVQSGASLTITNTDTTDTHIYGGNTDGSSGTLTLTGDGSTINLNKASMSFKDVKINNGAVLNLGGQVKLNYDSGSGAWYTYSNISAGASGTFSVENATVNVNNQGFINAETLNVSGATTINLNGEVKDVTSGSDYATAFLKAYGDSGTITFASTTANGTTSKPVINVAADKYGALYATKVNLTDTQVNIGAGATLIIDGTFSGTAAANEGVHKTTTLTLDDVTFDNQGTAIIGNPTSGSTAEVVSGTTTLTGAVKNYAQVTVKGTDADSGAATLVVSADQLSKASQEAKTGWFAGHSGAIILSGAAADAATLKIDGIDADGLNLNTDLDITSGSATLALGQIGISGNGTIAGSHLVLTDALSLASNKLTVDADTLELKAASTSSIDSIADFGVEALKAHDSIDINVSGTEATIDKAITLDRDYYVKTTDGNNTSTLNSVGKISGDDLNINGASGSIEVTGGAFTNERQDLTITSGSLSVTAEAGTNPVTGEDAVGPWPTGDNEAYLNANPASLKWNGDFKLAGAKDGDANVTVTGKTGADATLDLTSADVTWGSGSITVSGSSMDGEHTSASDFFARGGNGILSLTGRQLNDFTGTGTNTKLTANEGGIILVDGSVPTAIDVSKFQSASDGTAGTVNLSGGALLVTGNLSLTADAADEKLNAASGFIGADNLTVNNTTSGTNTFTVSGGTTLAAASSFTSDDTSVVFESGSTLLLDTNGFLNAYNNGSDSVGTVNVDKLSFAGTTTNEANLDVQTGNWTVIATPGTAETQILGDIDLANQAKINIGAGRDEVLRTGIGASLTADNLGISGSGSVAIGFSGAATFNTMQAGQNTNVDVDAGTLTLTGVLTDSALAEVASGSAPSTLSALGNADAIKAVAGINLNGAEVSVDNGGKFILENAAASALVKFNYTATGATTPSKVWVSDNLSGANITLANNSELLLNFASGSGELTAEQAQLLQDALADTIDGTSYISVGQMGFAINYDSGSMTTTWNDVKDFANYNVTNETMKQLLVTGVGAEDIAGHYGAVAATSGTNKIGVDGNLSLHSARDGYFAATTDASGKLTGPAAVDLVSNNSTFTVEGQGTVGTITGTGTDAADGNTVIFGQGTYQAGTTTVQGDVYNIARVEVQNEVAVTGDVEVGALNVQNHMSADNVTLVGDPTSSDMSSTVFGTLSVANELTVADENDLKIAGGRVETQTLTLADSGAIVYVGWDAQDLDFVNTDIDESKSYTGTLVAQSLDLNGGTLVVDPDFSQESALVAIGKFADAPTTRVADYELGTANGKMLVAQNSVLGLGFATEQDLRDFVSAHQTNGILTEYGAIAAVNGQFNLGLGDGLSLTAQTVSDYVDHVNRESSNNLSLNGDLTIANTIYFGDGTALKVNGEVLNAVSAANEALINFRENGTYHQGTLIADGGEILISGDLRAQSYQLFRDSDSKIDVNNLDGTASTSGITVTTENGLLVGTITDDSDGSVQLGINRNARSILSGVSDPVYDTIMAYINGYNSSWTDDQGQVHYDSIGTPTVDSDGDGVNDSAYEYNNYYIANSYDQGNGAALETAARLGVYGGAPQAALSAGKSSTDAIASRFGIGSALSNLTMAGNSAGATLWLSPVYKTAESDSFAAQGVDYGVDVDLYGVALGGDYTMSNGITIGAMFNLGSGEVDGSGAAASASNDFDYYGFGLYAGYTLGQFSVVGDVSYTVADNEVEASTAVDHIGAQMDSANLSVGVTGKYALEFNGVSVTPHVGLRFTNIDLDDYTIDGEEVIAAADSDKLNIFSIPVGVTIAKELKGESWTVAPSFDLTLTGQFGDDELDGSVNWAGVENLTTDTSTEVIDNFTYGATLGVEAQSVSGFALGLGVGYTGSSETDEFSAQAKVRYTF